MNMEISAAAQHLPPFWCHICNVPCASALNLQSHFMGAKHKKVEATLGNHGDEGPKNKKRVNARMDLASNVQVSEVCSGSTLEDQLNTCKDTEPAIGLEYIYEYHTNNSGHCIYVCKMCNCQSSLNNMFMHVAGIKHRIAYLSTHHPEMGIHSNYQIKTTSKCQRLRDTCFHVERMHGRKRVNVIRGASHPKSFADGLAPRPPISYGPNSKLQKMDFTTDYFVDIDGKPSVPRRDITFRELKAVHEAKLTETHSSGTPVQSSTGGQDNDRDLEVRSMEYSECDPDEFMCNSELFEFLDSFRIINDTDVSFILKVTESFSNALVRYKKNSAEKKALSNTAGSNAPHSNINQPSIPSAHGFNRYPEPATNYTPNQLFPSVSQFNVRGPITEPRFPLSIGPASNIPQGQWTNRTLPPYTAVQQVPPCVVPFPQGMPPPAMPPDIARGFPPGFPLAKDKATANFFASIKNMEVPEVIATLNNIAATNPAFRGIHVPSLIRYLTESGRLKTPSDTRYLQQ
ncbi:hypothetical protein FKM82_020570 [Ascaphus truei]